MVKFGEKEIKDFNTPYIIAEIGSNHNGDMELCKQLIKSAKESGCDCVKFQSWSKETIFSKIVYEDNYFLNDDYRDRTDYTLEQIVEKFSISLEELNEMNDYCKKIGIDFSCTPFSQKELDFLVDELAIDFIKVASMDLNNLPFLAQIAKKKKPVILSTGFGSIEEIREAVDVLSSNGVEQLALLHCISDYPPKEDEVNLNNIDLLRDEFPQCEIGFSDHSVGIAVPMAAVAKGACIIEKHFTLDKEMFGWDHKVSATPEEMAEIVNLSKIIQKALGRRNRQISEGEKSRIAAYRRSIVAARDISSGTTIDADDLDFKRPGTGVEPKLLPSIVGKVAKRDLKYDELVSLEDFGD